MNTMGIDMATAYNRYQFLGYEFLLWLWYLSSKAPQELRKIETEKPVEITFGDSISIEAKGTGWPEKLTIKGLDAGFEEAFIALAKGGSIIQANMVLAVGGEEGQEYRFTLGGEDLTVKTLKCSPDIEHSAMAQDEIEGAVMEKQFLTGILFSTLDSLYQDFIDRRMGSTWKTHYSAIREWIAEKSGTVV